MTDMKKYSFRRVPAVLGILALAGLVASYATADEPAAEPQEAASEESAKRPKNGLRWSTASDTLFTSPSRVSQWTRSLYLPNLGPDSVV